MNIITTNSALISFCQQVETNAYITVDTEFIRDKTYFPRLCLLQIAGEDVSAIIDPLAAGIDLSPVFALLQKPDLIKVFHACRQDIEIFYLLAGAVPRNIFDTQIAASMCAYGESVSYETLVNKIVGAELDKSSRFTDWAARPLSQKQLTYALSDVTHLRVIYEHLRAKLVEIGRDAWVAEEHAHLLEPELYQINTNDAWKRLRYGNMRPKNLAVLRELASFREVEARKNDVPRGRILKDETLLELAVALPQKSADFTRMRNLEKNISQNRLDEVVSCVKRALALSPEDFPQTSRNNRSSENIVSAVAMLQLLLKVKSDIHGIAAPIIAGKDDLEALALGEIIDDNSANSLHGWRYDIFGQDAELLIAGKLKMSLNPENKQVIFWQD